MKSFIGQLRWLFSPRDKRKFLGLALLMALSAVMEMAGIGILLGAVALFLSPQTPAAHRLNLWLSGVVPGVSDNGRIVLVVVIIALLLAGKNLFALWIVRIQSVFLCGKQVDLARRLFGVYVGAESESFRQLSPDECFSNISRVTQVCNLILLPAAQIAADLLVIAALSIAALVLFPGITFAGMLFMFLAAALVSRITRSCNRRIGKRFLDCAIAEEHCRQAGILGKPGISAMVAGEYFVNKFTSAYRQCANYSAKLYQLGQIPRLSLETSAIAVAAGIFCFLLLSGVPQAEIMLTFAVLTAAVARVLPALSRCHYNLSLLRQSTPLLDNILEVLQNLPQEDLSAAGIAADAAAEIEIREVNFAYRDGKEIFDSLSLLIPHGSMIAIAGKSGRGKSTLAELLLGMLRPQSGKITAGGVSIYNDLAVWRRQIGYVPQNIFIMDAPLRENVAFGVDPAEIDDRKVSAVLQLAQLENFTPEQPVSSNTLSGGQCQRIGIARALYRDAKLLILDEATSALDPATEQAFCQTLQALRGKVTLLVISHRESTLQSCDRIISL